MWRRDSKSWIYLPNQQIHVHAYMYMYKNRVAILHLVKEAYMYPTVRPSYLLILLVTRGASTPDPL